MDSYKNFTNTVLSTVPNGLPIGWGSHMQTLAPMLLENITRKLLERYSHLYHKDLSEYEYQCFMSLTHVFGTTFDIVDVDEYKDFVLVDYANFFDEKCRIMWEAINNIIECATSTENPKVVENWITGNDFVRYRLSDLQTLDKKVTPASLQFNSFIRISSEPSEHTGLITIDEIGRGIAFDNNLIVKEHHGLDLVAAKFDRSFLLKLSGDIESNPGPVQSKPISSEVIQKMQKELAALKKFQKQQDRFLQRRIEMEKRQRNKNRKNASEQKRVAQGLYSWLEDVTKDAVKEELTPTVELAHKALSKLLAAIDSIKATYDIAVTYDLFSIMTTLVSISKACMDKNYMLLTLYVTNLAHLLGVTLNDLIALLPFAKHEDESTQTENEEDKAYAQSYIDEMCKYAKTKGDNFVNFCGLVTFCIGIFITTCTGVIPKCKEMANHLSIIGRAASGIRSIKELFNWLYKYVLEIYYTRVYGISKDQYDFIQLFPEMENLYAACKIIEGLTEQLIAASAPVAEQILEVQHKLNDYALQASRSNMTQNIRMISALQRTISVNYNHALKSPARMHIMRDEPLSMYLFGEPGVGKTTMVEALKCRMYDKWYKDKMNINSVAYVRKANNKFWDNYVNQPICLLDDFGNVKDTLTTNNEEYQELEYMVNNCIFPLTMADVGSKGKVNFTSDIIIATSNAKYPEIKSLISPGAVYRRFHLWAEVTINPIYGKITGTDANGKNIYVLDSNRLPKDDKDKGVVFVTKQYIINLYKVQYNSRNQAVQVSPDKQGLTFDQFWEHILETYNDHKFKSATLKKQMMAEYGITDEAEPITEKEVMEQFDRIFDPDKFVNTISDEMDEFERKAAERERSMSVSSCDSDEFLAAIDDHEKSNSSYQKYKAKFSEYATTCRNSLKGLCDKIFSVIRNAGNKLLQIGNFFLGMLQSMFGSIKSYMPTVPIDKTIAFLSTMLVGGIYMWYNDMFPGQSDFCSFNKSPTYGNQPCRKCSMCDLINYPDHGNMVQHFLMTAIQEIHFKTYKKYGYDLGKIVRKTLPTHMDYLAKEASRVKDEWFSDLVDRTYRNPELLAESKVYDLQPKGIKQDRLIAHGDDGKYLTCKSVVEIGAKRVAERDVVQIEQTTRVMLNNSVWLQCVDTQGMCSRSNAMFLVGRTVITTAHTVLNPPGKYPFEKIVITNPYAAKPCIEIPYEECKITQIRQMDGSLVDLALISLPACVASRRNILSMFISAKDICLLDEGKMVFSGFHEMEAGKMVVQEKHPDTFKVSTKTTEYYLHEVDKCPKNLGNCMCCITIGNHIEYDIDTTRGNCGALLAIKNKCINTKLIGFHVAGGRGMFALGVLTTNEFLTDALKQHVDKFQINRSYLIDGRMAYTRVAENLVDPYHQVSILQQGDCINGGRAKPVNAPTKTNLTESLVFDKIQEHTTKPAYLTKCKVNGELIDPMIVGIKKVLGPQVWIDSKILDAAINDVFNMYGKPVGKVGIVHTLEEAIVGIENDPYKRPINRTTSPGYPYNLDNPKKGKTFWFGEDETYITDHPTIVQDVGKLLDMARVGIRGDAISIATLKSEKRPIKKVEEGKTRVFEACPQHLVVAMRMYFLDFTAHIMRNRIDNGVAVGINPYSLEWTKLAHHLLTKGDNMVAGDFSNFDGSLIMQVLVRIVEKINDWYNDGPDNALIRATLWEHVCNADILVHDEIIRKTHSQPSGNPLTVIINSIFNQTIMRVAYLMIKKQNNMPMICDYRKYVSEIVYGDDDIKSVHPNIIGWFNQQTITDVLKSIGMTYTDETKSGSVLPCKSLKQTAFLKRSFVIQDDGTYFAPMEISNILEITNWIRGKALRNATLNNCEVVLAELALHPRAVYEKWSSRIQEALAEVNINIVVPTYFEQMELYHAERDNYDRSEYVPLW